MAVNGKQKGASFERSICTRLSLHITNGAREDVFWRSAMSGGRSTVMHRRGKEASRQAGDITAIAPEGHKLTDEFFIECKFYKDLSLVPFFFGQKKGNLFKFWETAKSEARKHKKVPMLIARQNILPTFLLTKVPLEEHSYFASVSEHKAYLYWFDKVFPKPKPKIKNVRTGRK